MKKLLTLLLAAVMTVQLAVPAWAEQAPAEEDPAEVVEVFLEEDNPEMEEEAPEEEAREETPEEEPQEEENQNESEPEEALPEDEEAAPEDTEPSDPMVEDACVSVLVTFHCAPEELTLELHPAEDPALCLEPESDEGGAERVYRMTPGEYLVTASAEGFVARTEIVLITDDAEQEISVSLEAEAPAEEPAEEVPTEEPAEEEPAEKPTEEVPAEEPVEAVNAPSEAPEEIPVPDADCNANSLNDRAAAQTNTYTILYKNLEQFDGAELENVSNPNPASGSYYTETKLKSASAKGYTFGGWYLDPYFSEKVTSIPAGNRQDVTLYAKWIPYTYTIKFNGNGSSGGSMKAVTGTYDKALVLPESAFIRTGYTFGGWKLNKNGTAKNYDDCDEVLNLTSAKGGSVTLYAHWDLNSYSITFDGNGAEGAMEDMVLPYNATKALPANAFTRTGYTFAGWSTKADGSGTVYKDGAYVKNLADGNKVQGITLYAKWKPNTYTVTFYANGGSGSTTKQTFTYDKEATLMTPKFTRKGYGIQSWNTEKNGTGETFELGEKVENLLESGNLNLYAVWGAARYNVAFHANGGYGEMAPMKGVVYNDFSSSLPANTFQKDGYHFVGWATSKTGKAVFEDGEIIGKNLTDKDGAIVTLYAVWAVNTYTVNFFAEEATSGRMLPLTGRKYGASVTLPSNTFKRVGYSFVGWSLEPGGVVKFKNGEKVPCLITTADEDGTEVNLYAAWKITEYPVTYGNVTKEEIEEYELPEEYTIEEGVALPELARAGYEFGGWYTNSKFPSNSKTNGWEAGATGSKKVYAKWTANTYSISFNSGAENTSGLMKDLKGKKCGSSVTLPGNSFKRRGYSFVGWSFEQDGEVFFKNAQKVKLYVEDGAVVTLYAVWKPIDYKIGYSGVTTQERKNFPTTYNVENHVTLPTPQRSGYTFVRWTYGGKTIETTDGLAANITVKAVWRKNPS